MDPAKYFIKAYALELAIPEPSQSTTHKNNSTEKMLFSFLEEA